MKRKVRRNKERKRRDWWSRKRERIREIWNRWDRRGWAEERNRDEDEDGNCEGLLLLRCLRIFHRIRPFFFFFFLFFCAFPLWNDRYDLGVCNVCECVTAPPFLCSNTLFLSSYSSPLWANKPISLFGFSLLTSVGPSLHFTSSTHILKLLILEIQVFI